MKLNKQHILCLWSLGTLKNNVGERYLNLKLVEKERAGFCYLPNGIDEATLFNIAIDPAQQGKGYGSFYCKV